MATARAVPPPPAAAGRAVPPPPIGQRALRPGCYASVPTFFTADEEIDVISFSKHIARLAFAGVFPVIGDSTGESPFLTPDERSRLVKAARAALQANGLEAVPVIASADGSSLKQSLELATDAAAAGADAVLVTPSGYYAEIHKTPYGKAALREYFVELSNRSPVPVLIHNSPSASGGINMDSDFLIDLARFAPNTCGLKLDCNDMGKLLRVCSVTALPEFATSHPRRHPNAPFLVLSSAVDGLYPALIARGAGAITALANITPYTVRHLFDTAVTSINAGSTAHMVQAQNLQSLIAQAEHQLNAHGGVAGIKWALSRYATELGYDYAAGLPRKPLPPLPAGVDMQLERALYEIITREKQAVSGGVSRNPSLVR